MIPVRQGVRQYVHGVHIPPRVTGGVSVDTCATVGITSRYGTVDCEHLL